jgi:hypothetical protein
VVGPNAYELDLSSALDIRVMHRHPVVAGEKLKPYYFRRLDAPIHDEPEHIEDNAVPLITEPEQGLQSSPELIQVQEPDTTPTATPASPILVAPAPEEAVPESPVVRATKTKPKLKITGFTKRNTHGVDTWHVQVLTAAGETMFLDEFVERASSASTKAKRKALFSTLKQAFTTLDEGRAALPPWATMLATVHSFKLPRGRLGAAVLAMDEHGAVYLLWGDGDCQGYTADEWSDHFLPIRVNAIQWETLLAEEWNMRQPESVLKLLQELQPGPWQLRHASNLCNKMLGGTKFNPFLVVTDRGEVGALVPYLRLDTLKSKQGLDPFAGTRTIPRVMSMFGVKMITNELNPMFPAHYHHDALNPASYRPNKLGKFDYVVTSVPFAFADIAIPLLASAFEALFLHAPSWYIFQGSRARHAWLKSLVPERRSVVLHVNEERNTEFGKYAVWVCIFRSRDIARLYLKDVNRMFERSIPVVLG